MGPQAPSNFQEGEEVLTLNVHCAQGHCTEPLQQTSILCSMWPVTWASQVRLSGKHIVFSIFQAMFEAFCKY